jgi:hypothetical protein
MNYSIRFIEAHQIQQETDKLEKQEYVKYDKEKINKLKTYTDKLTNTHNTERSSLNRKLESEYEIMNKKNKDEVEIINLNYRKKKNELENQQNTEMTINTNVNKLKSSKFG